MEELIINFGVFMSVLRPKYQLNKTAIQGDRITVPAPQFTELTTRRYPYPRVGTRAPNGMFPYVGNPGVLKPHYILDKTQVQGVMPAGTYERLTGKMTTQPQIPTYVATDSGLALRYPPTVWGPTVRAPVRAPALQDWGMFFWGAVAGMVFTIGMVYGVIPAMAEWAAVAVKKRY